jgi:phenylacetate-coenzyme A ligase PaaK-like adenylate-forming protein
MYPALLRAFRPYWRGGRELRRRQKEIEQTQWWSIGEIETLQLDRLKKLIKYAYEHVPYYSKLYKSLEIHPDDIKSLKDFQALPFLTREDIKSHINELVTDDPNHEIFPDSTGGSTGVPMQFFIERAYDRWDQALELRGRGWYGVREGDRIAFVWGAKQDMPDWSMPARLKARILQERYLNAFGMTEQKMQLFAESLIKWKPAMFRAYASALTLFAQYLKDHKITGIEPRLIETTAEKVTLPQRDLLESVFHCKVADWYSAREMGTIAFQCPEGSLHVGETRYLEIVAKNNGAQPGELGEVVITSLHQYGMPFIRYKIGDMAILETHSCSCGRGLPVLREVVGRMQDFLVTSDGRFVHGGYFPHTFRLYPEISQYQVYQPDRDHLQVRFVCKCPIDSDWIAAIQHELHECFGNKMNISVDIVDNIPLTMAGKQRFIISDVKPDFV